MEQKALAEFLHPEKNTYTKSCTFVLVHKCHHLKLECGKTDILRTYFANEIIALAFEQTPIACFVAVQSLLSSKTNKKWQLKIQLSLPEGPQFTCCNQLSLESEHSKGSAVSGLSLGLLGVLQSEALFSPCCTPPGFYGLSICG